MRLNNKQAGKNNRTKFPNIAKKFPECVFIERVTNQYSLRKRSGSAGATAKLIQFPVILSHAITSHKIQGQTIPSPAKVVIDLNTVFEEAQAYVMLSRVQQLDQIHILNSLDESKIKVSQTALKELHRLKEVSLNENPTPWIKQDQESVKIASLNCAGLKAH